MFSAMRLLALLPLVSLSAAQNCCPHVASLCAKPEWTALTVPAGFCVLPFADIPGGARNVETHEFPDLGSVIVVAGRQSDVHILIDVNQDGTVDRRLTVPLGQSRAHTATMRNGELYVGQGSRLLRIANIMDVIREGTTPNIETLYTNFGTGTLHANRDFAWGKNNTDLYIALGAPCNICIPENAGRCPISQCFHGTIVVVENVSSKGPLALHDIKVFAAGNRNSVGMTAHPETDVLWFTDNGRDNWGDNRPNDELNLAPTSGMHFGFPYCYGYGDPDPEFNSGDCSAYVPAFRELGPHVASLGLEFSRSTSFPPPYNRGVFIAEHGSWNRRPYIGFRITHVNDESPKRDYSVFLDGFLTNPTFGTRTGRPTDVDFLPDGSLLVSDDYQNLVFRVAYVGAEKGKKADAIKKQW